MRPRLHVVPEQPEFPPRLLEVTDELSLLDHYDLANAILDEYERLMHLTRFALSVISDES